MRNLLMETLLVILHTRMMIYVLITKRWMIIHSVSTMLQQFTTVKLHDKIVHSQLTQFCVFSPLRLQIDAFDIIYFVCVIDMNRGPILVNDLLVFQCNGQRFYSCGITPYSRPTKEHTATHIVLTLIDYVLNWNKVVYLCGKTDSPWPSVKKLGKPIWSPYYSLGHPWKSWQILLVT